MLLCLRAADIVLFSSSSPLFLYSMALDVIYIVDIFLTRGNVLFSCVAKEAGRQAEDRERKKKPHACTLSYVCVCVCMCISCLFLPTPYPTLLVLSGNEKTTPEPAFALLQSSQSQQPAKSHRNLLPAPEILGSKRFSLFPTLFLALSRPFYKHNAFNPIRDEH